MTEQFTHDFYAEVQRRNKQKFIEIATKDIEKQQKHKKSSRIYK